MFAVSGTPTTQYDAIIMVTISVCVAAVVIAFIYWVLYDPPKAKGEGSEVETDGTAVAEPACAHSWEKDGDRVVNKEYDDDSGEVLDRTYQPCRCVKCGEMTSFEL